MTRKRFWVWFAPIVLGELVGQLLDVTLLDYVFKPMLVPALLIYLHRNTRNRGTASIRLLVAGLSFSWLGDVILLFSARSEPFFAAGLGAFLIAHLFYIAAYIRSVRGAPGKAFFRRRPGWLLPFLLLFAGLYGLLYPALGSMRIPVFVYTATILLMAVFALNRKDRISEASFYPIFDGALLFILSDSLLAFDKFLVPIPFSGVLVMSTYIAAQYLIVEGIIACAQIQARHLRSPGEVLTDLQAATSQRETLRSAMHGEELSSAFRARLMLIVTGVNGCRYCSYVHARETLAEGISQDEIGSLGKRMFEVSPPEEVPAPIYAQHWAEADGKPDPAVREQMRQRYGRDVLERIETVLRGIRMGNLMGNTMDYVLYRVSFGRWGAERPTWAEAQDA